MESLQLSQVLADLSNLGAAEPEAAAVIVTANKTTTQDNTHLQPPPPRRPTGSMKRSWSSEPSTAPKYDKYGRRLMITTPVSRGGSTGNSTPGTPRRVESDFEDDLERASTLMALYDIRAKLKQQDNSSLLKAREKINALAAKQQAQAQAEKNQKTAEELRRNRYSYPKPGL